MKKLSHLIIFLLSLLALAGSTCDVFWTCLIDPYHTEFTVIGCEPTTNKLQAYRVVAGSNASANINVDNGEGAPVYDPLNGQDCSTDLAKLGRQQVMKGRPNLMPPTPMAIPGLLPIGPSQPSNRHPLPRNGDTSTQTLGPSLLDRFPFLSPLPSNPPLPAGDRTRLPATCSASLRSYLVNYTKGTVTAVGICPLSLIKTISVAPHPLQIQSTPDGLMVLVTGADGALTFIDTATNTVKATMDLSNYIPSGLAISPDGARAYVTNMNTQSALLVIDIPNRKVLSTIPLPQSYARVVTLTPDGSQAWVNYLTNGVLTVVDILTGTVAGTIGTGNVADRGIAFNPTGTKAYVAVDPNQIVVVDTSTFAIRARLTVGASPNDVVAVPGGSRIFVTGEGDATIWWIDPTIDRVVGGWRPPGRTAGSMGLVVTSK